MPDSLNTQDLQHGGKSRLPRILIGAGIAVALIVLSLAWSIAYLAKKVPANIALGSSEGLTRSVDKTWDSIKKIVSDIDSAVHFVPEISYSEKTIPKETKGKLELASAERTFEHQYEWIHKWLGSVKTIKMSGDFRAKAGFDLEKHFLLSFSDDLQVRAEFPEPEILGCELIQLKINDIEQGWWNKISEEERKQALNLLLQSARNRVDKSNLKTLAREKLEEQFREIVLKNGGTITFNFQERKY